MQGSTDIEMLRGALQEAEDELCALSDTLVNEGWDTTTISFAHHGRRWFRFDN
ncbi:hypothetical protein [Burkholderia cepacia]|uniref:hypothetical protein n=1 Tax=Burkholderia cepacia TaxID=292 RepID=UPI002AB71D74|nr:hypothetical protein [Burkholderia cepacia]